MVEYENEFVYPDFYEKYWCAAEDDMGDRALTWDISIGLQSVDGLLVSDNLKDIAEQHIDGRINISQAKEQIATYYENHKELTGTGTDEADKVAANIAEVLNDPSFLFSPAGFVGIHKKLFHNVFPFAGKIREYNITKKEPVLDGDTVRYAHYADLSRALSYDFDKEKRFSYADLTAEQMMEHIAHFISDIWQIHPFAEGNTRTTAVFCIKYLRYLGFRVNNRLFSRKARYFRNSLVRANHTDVSKGISADYSFLIRFFRNLLLGESHELHSRDTHMNAAPVPMLPITADVVQTASNGAEADVSVRSLLKAIGVDTLSVRQMMSRLNLRGRDNFLKNYFTPANSAGFLSPLYPDSPHHPRQKYFLSALGHQARKRRARKG